MSSISAVKYSFEDSNVSVEVDSNNRLKLAPLLSQLVPHVNLSTHYRWIKDVIDNNSALFVNKSIRISELPKALVWIGSNYSAEVAEFCSKYIYINDSTFELNEEENILHIVDNEDVQLVSKAKRVTILPADYEWKYLSLPFPEGAKVKTLCIGNKPVIDALSSIQYVYSNSRDGARVVLNEICSELNICYVRQEGATNNTPFIDADGFNLIVNRAEGPNAQSFRAASSSYVDPEYSKFIGRPNVQTLIRSFEESSIASTSSPPPEYEFKAVSYSLNDLYSLAGRIELIMKIKTQNNLCLETHPENDNYYQAKQLMYIVGNYENQKAAKDVLTRTLATISSQSQNFKNRLVNGKSQLYCTIPQFLEYLLPHIRSTFAEHLRTTIRQQDGLVSSGSVLAVNQTLQNASENNAASSEVQNVIESVQEELEDQVIAERPEILNQPITITTSKNRNRLSLPTTEHPAWVCEIFKALNITRGLSSPNPSSQNVLYLIGSKTINSNANSTLSQLKADFPENDTMSQSQATDLSNHLVIKFGKSNRGQNRLESYKNILSILYLSNVDHEVQDTWETCLKGFTATKGIQLRNEFINLIEVFECMYPRKKRLQTVVSSFVGLLVPDAIQTLLKIHPFWSGKVYLFGQEIPLEKIMTANHYRMIPSPIEGTVLSSTDKEEKKIKILEKELEIKKELVDLEKIRIEMMDNKKQYFDDLIAKGFTKTEALEFMKNG